MNRLLPPSPSRTSCLMGFPSYDLNMMSLHPFALSHTPLTYTCADALIYSGGFLRECCSLFSTNLAVGIGFWTPRCNYCSTNKLWSVYKFGYVGWWECWMSSVILFLLLKYTSALSPILLFLLFINIENESSSSSIPTMHLMSDEPSFLWPQHDVTASNCLESHTIYLYMCVDALSYSGFFWGNVVCCLVQTSPLA